MNGIDINVLNLYNDGVKIWSKSGQQGNVWNKAEVTIKGKYDVSDSDVSYKGAKSSVSTISNSQENGKTLCFFWII